MADTFTTLLHLTKMQISAHNNDWGDELNAEVIQALDDIYRDMGGALVTGGAADAYTVAVPNHTEYVALTDGLHCRVRIHATNLTTTPTFNYCALGVDAIKKKVAGVLTDPAIGDLPIGNYADMLYSATDSAWILQNPDLATNVAAMIVASDAALKSVEDQSVSGGARVVTKSLGTISSGTVTPDGGDRAIQMYINNGAHTLAPFIDLDGTTAGSYILRITNGSTPGVITTSGWTKVVGSFDTVAGHHFTCSCVIIGGNTLLVIQALQ